MENLDHLPEDGPTMNPPEFTDPPIDSCTLSSSRIFNPDTNDCIRNEDGEVRIHIGVMVKNGGSSTFDQVLDQECANTDTDGDEHYDDEDDKDSDNDSDSDSDSSISSIPSGNDSEIQSPLLEPKRAYLYVRNEDSEICDAIYGDVHRGKVLHPRPDMVGWQLTPEICAIKRMPWSEIRAGRREGKIEDPRTEIATMILLRAYYNATRLHGANGGNGIAPTAREAMRETNLVMPLDFLYDNENLYIIMPCCDGGELFARQREFTEEVCRTSIVPQMLNGLKFLQGAKICHRDISLENFVLDGEGANMKLIIIDLGMARRIPYSEDNTRQLISPQYRCGKRPYMSPEIYQIEPFDGHAVDLWAVGVILFILLSGGRHPWNKESPNICNKYYKMISRGLLVKMCRNNPNLNISMYSASLLDKMLRDNPRDRLSLGQILDHRWINGMT